jgi:hypothetical protein
MKRPMLILFMLALLAGCENTKGQNRHDPNHHEQSAQKNR